MEERAAGDVACILFEPYLGSGGAVPAPEGFARQLRGLADEIGAVLIYDEVQSGSRRTGPLFAFQADAIVPHLIVLAKGIAPGVPMAVVAGPRQLLFAPLPGTLWNSYGGGPLACVAAHATLDMLQDPGLEQRVGAVAERIRASVNGLGRTARRRGPRTRALPRDRRGPRPRQPAAGSGPCRADDDPGRGVRRRGARGRRCGQERRADRAAPPDHRRRARAGTRRTRRSSAGRARLRSTRRVSSTGGSSHGVLQSVHERDSIRTAR